MKKTKKILSILLACMMLMSVLSIGAVAEDYINANDRWFGYGVNTYLLNPTITAGDTDGLSYKLNIESDGLLFVEHRNKDVDYTITMTVNGNTYVGGYTDGQLYNAPLVSLPVKTGDVAIINVVTKDAAAGIVYANMNVISGDANAPVKVKSTGIQVYVAAGQTIYYQDDSLQAVYATSYVNLSGDVADTTFYTVSKNSESGATSKKAFTDTDGDGVIETKLGGSLGSAGAPPVKPAWAIENASAEDRTYMLTIVDEAHECVYDNDADADCNNCGAIRELACAHAYDHNFDGNCNLCGEQRDVELPMNIAGTSISSDVNGLAWSVETQVNNVTKNEKHIADYTNATVGGYKLVKMGAVVSNNYAELGYAPKLDDVDGVRTVDAVAEKVCEINEEDGTVTFAIRVVNIPDNHKNREICILTYVIFEDENGEQYIQYCDNAYASYNQLAQ